MTETSDILQLIAYQVKMMTGVLHHLDITQHEISELPPATKTYESVGRMFLLTDLKDLKNNLESQKTHLTARKTELEARILYLEKDLIKSKGNSSATKVETK